MNPKKTAVVLILPVLLLSACAGPRDLATEPSALPAKEQGIARRISEAAASTCAIGPAHRRHDPTPPSGRGVQFRKLPVIVKLFSSTNTSFYMAELLIDNVWDNVYFDTKSEQIVCGEKNWQAVKGAASVIFREVGSEQISRESKAALPQKSTAANAEPLALPASPEKPRRQDTVVDESRRAPENAPAPPRANPPSSSKPPVTRQELAEPSTKGSRSSAAREERGKCIIKPAMTDEEIARCK